MKNKILIGFIAIVSTGCASMYPGWEKVNVVDSVFNKPCTFVEDYHKNSLYNTIEDLKKVAIVYKANTVIMNPNGNINKLYYCSPDQPINFEGGKVAQIARNIYYPSATKVDFDKAIAECKYQAHMATVDTSRVAPSKTYINTISNEVNDAQIYNMQKDQLNNYLHDTNLKLESYRLNNECLKAKGFVLTISANQADFDEIKKICPDGIMPCFIPGAPKQ
jgi:hypothetical protein